MKNTTLIYLILLLGFTQCKTNSKRNSDIDINSCDSLLIGKEYADTLITLYEIDSSFYPYLDTIIESEKECRFYNECKTGFSIIMYKHYDYFDLSIATVPNIYLYEYSKCQGLFIYKGHRFISENIDIPYLLKKSNNKYSIKYAIVKDKNYLLPQIDDRWSAWYFKLEKNKYVLKDHYQCVK